MGMQQFRAPARRPRFAWNVGLGRCGGQAPARGSGSTLARRGAARLSPVRQTAQDEAGHTLFQAGQVQPPSGQPAQLRNFAHHGSQPAFAQRHFHGSEGFRIVAWAGQHQPGRIEPVFQQSRGIKVTTRSGPQHRQARRDARQQAGDEAGHDGAGFRVRPSRADLMPSAERQAAARQVRVDPCIAEGQHGAEQR